MKVDCQLFAVSTLKTNFTKANLVYLRDQMIDIQHALCSDVHCSSQNGDLEQVFSIMKQLTFVNQNINLVETELGVNSKKVFESGTMLDYCLN